MILIVVNILLNFFLDFRFPTFGSEVQFTFVRVPRQRKGTNLKEIQSFSGSDIQGLPRAPWPQRVQFHLLTCCSIFE